MVIAGFSLLVYACFRISCGGRWTFVFLVFRLYTAPGGFVFYFCREEYCVVQLVENKFCRFKKK